MHNVFQHETRNGLQILRQSQKVFKNNLFTPSLDQKSVLTTKRSLFPFLTVLLLLLLTLFSTTDTT